MQCNARDLRVCVCFVFLTRICVFCFFFVTHFLSFSFDRYLHYILYIVVNGGSDNVHRFAVFFFIIVVLVALFVYSTLALK